jgi:Kelch motif
MPWAYKPSLATPRFGLAAATFDAPAPQSGSRIYAIGGGDLSGNAILASVETYDTSTPEENWLPINPMHTARAGLAAASGSDGLHALGGINPFITGGILATHEIYDPATAQWLPPAPSMPTPREYLAAATGPDGLIYAIGGLNFDASGQAQYLDTVEAYDPCDRRLDQPGADGDANAASRAGGGHRPRRTDLRHRRVQLRGGAVDRRSL